MQIANGKSQILKDKRFAISDKQTRAINPRFHYACALFGLKLSRIDKLVGSFFNRHAMTAAPQRKFEFLILIQYSNI
ncbi:MAG: hypothetical protein A2912_05050 [Candidatus Buchananbacteria bacterium RIFCSPLOWO2_01_FULL_40_23b]|uniref:Uncharacterized protein n=1 Tax=Candidatus Buchananbacteria bacterium RIFCSPLOWO2_01_FULL_40_23b TaxID=1797544 RepID=A0A1G1YMU7_9BACT|nr:MAG: hypothetical protein A2912_05050 [Candidatus Buchananbacteria bacterium RIFCSPLOWO2_01_FULL_40_23b]